MEMKEVNHPQAKQPKATFLPFSNKRKQPHATTTACPVLSAAAAAVVGCWPHNNDK